MTPAAKDMLFTILSTSQTASSTAINATNIDSTSSDLSSLLADAVVWADRIKNHNNTFDAFHYVHTAEESNCTYIDARDCKDGVCVVGGIKRFASSFLSSCNYGDSAPFLTPEVDQESTEARIRDIAESIKFMVKKRQGLGDFVRGGTNVKFLHFKIDSLYRRHFTASSCVWQGKGRVSDKAHI